MTFLSKTLYKLKLLFTNPKKLWKILGDMVRSRLYAPVENPEGNRFTTDLEVDTLKKYAKQAKVGIVEIGVLDGKTTKEMASVASVPMYGIDPIIVDSMNKWLIGNEEKIRNNMSFYSQFYFFKDYSYNVVKGWEKSFDFIFIDGDHTYEAVKQDFEDWVALIDKDGYIAFHDSARVTSIPDAFDGWEGPIRLVNELKQSSAVRYIETKDSITVFQKI